MDTPSTANPPVPTFKDRRTGLIVFGILEIMLGCVCALMLPLSLFGQVMAARQAGSEFDLALAAPTLLTFTVLSTSLVWLGVGSIMARRWARALLLCLGWMGLCMGLAALVVMVPVLGSMDEMIRGQGQELPPGALVFAKVIAMTTITVIYILIPGTLVLFYRSVNVKLTCENRDPVERWTDRCPLPVLAMCILQAFGAISLLLMPRFGSVMPLAGILLTGWSARILWVGFAALSLYGAWGFYRLQHRAWMIYTGAIVLLGLSSTLTFLRVGLLDYYRAIKLPETQIQQIAASPLVQGRMFIWLSTLSLALFVAYLLYLRRYFVTARPSSPVA